MAFPYTVLDFGYTPQSALGLNHNNWLYALTKKAKPEPKRFATLHHQLPTARG